MFDYLRNLRKTAEEKRQETVAAYLDGALHGRSRQQFEQQMAQDEALRQEVEQLLLIKQSLRRLPQRDVPRNFILDPAAYGRPSRQPWVQAYPVLRTATALAAFFFIFAIAAGIFTTMGGGDMALAPVADVAEVEQTEVMTFNAEEAADEVMSEAAPAAEAAIAEEPVAESAAEESALVEAVETMEEAAASSAAEATGEPLPAISATQVAPLPGDREEATSEDGEGAIPAPQETREAQPTPSTPRVGPPTPLPDRVQDDDAAGGVPEAIDETESVATTAVLPEETVRETTVDESVSALFWLQIALGALLLLLLGLTFYARRQR